MYDIVQFSSSDYNTGSYGIWTATNDVRHLGHSADNWSQWRRFSVMIVHSFSSEHSWLDDYQAFLALFDKKGGVGDLVALFHLDGIELYSGWAAGAVT